LLQSIESMQSVNIAVVE